MTKRRGWQPGAAQAFLLALVTAAAFFVPLMIYNKGYFLFLGDFNVQQIPFYQLAHEAVRSGEIFWNWRTDLGANFIGSYSFYLLFSPFFWLTLPFPTEFVPHLMAPLLILKTACASLTSYLYIKRFVRDRRWAVIGGMLYAFSGFMTFNIFFNHFHEVAIFFPLLLISLEELVTHDRRGFFAAMVAVNCLVNYWFFIGEVVFVILYVIVRIATGGWGCTLRKFMALSLEAVLGVLIAAVGLLPSVLALIGNPRTGSDDLLTGWLMWIYGFNQRLPAIIQSFFFPPEMPSRPNFFPDMGAKWSSLSAWLPVFSASGVIAFCHARRKNFHKRMIVMSMIMALVPVFNAAFVMFNGSYYARWFYMPILMMCVATGAALEEREAMRDEWKSGFYWTAGFVLVISAAVAFSPIVKEEGKMDFGLYDNAAGFWLIVLTAILCLLLTALLIFLWSRRRDFYRLTCATLSVFIVLFSLGYLTSGKNSRTNDDWFIQTALGGRKQLTLPNDDLNRNFERSDLYDSMDNLGMFWGLPNIQCFHSIVPASTMEFYPAIGIKRDVSSKPPVSYTALRSLLSVRWLFIAENGSEQAPMPDYTFVGSQMGYNLYENDQYIPMGFAYDKAIGVSACDKLADEQKSRYMLHALMLDEEALVRNMDLIAEEVEPDYVQLSAEGIEQAADARRRMGCDTFFTDRMGFTATINLPEERLVFFSVPYERGWSATVNEKPAVIEKANIGFMAVRVPAGATTIRFDFMTPGLIEGLKFSGIGLVALFLYLLATCLTRRASGLTKGPSPRGGAPRPPMPEAPLSPNDRRRLSLEEYLETLDELPPIEPKKQDGGKQ